MATEITIPSDYMYQRRSWKSEQQHINEYLFCAGFPYRQIDMTDLLTGMQYIGTEPKPLLARNADGSIRVFWQGVPVAPRVIDYGVRVKHHDNFSDWRFML